MSFDFRTVTLCLNHVLFKRIISLNILNVKCIISLNILTLFIVKGLKNPFPMGFEIDGILNYFQCATTHQNLSLLLSCKLVQDSQPFSVTLIQLFLASVSHHSIPTFNKMYILPHE